METAHKYIQFTDCPVFIICKIIHFIMLIHCMVMIIQLSDGQTLPTGLCVNSVTQGESEPDLGTLREMKQVLKLHLYFTGSQLKEDNHGAMLYLGECLSKAWQQPLSGHCWLTEAAQQANTNDLTRRDKNTKKKTKQNLTSCLST